MEEKTAEKIKQSIRFRQRSSIRLKLVMGELTCRMLKKPICRKNTPPLPPPAYLKQKYKLFEFENMNDSLDNAPIKPARTDLLVSQREQLPSIESDTSSEQISLLSEMQDKDDEFLLLEEMASQFSAQEKEYLQEIDDLR